MIHRLLLRLPVDRPQKNSSTSKISERQDIKRGTRQNLLSTRKNLGPEKKFGPERAWNQKKFGTRKNLGPE